MKKLIETDSPLYLKRLVRELNSAGILNGFYAPVATFSVRCNRARLRAGAIQCHSYDCTPEWFTPSVNRFDDGNGQEIVATRKS